MALADTANLVVKLSLAGNFNKQLATAQRGLGRFDAALSKTEGRAYRAGQQIGTGIKNAAKIAAVGVGILVSQVALGLNSLVKLEEATAQTEAVLKSTGGAAGVTADQVRKLAEKYEALNATVGDEVIQQGQNLLLTFTAVRKDAFEPALAAALDLSTAMGTDLDSAIKTVGKALSEPEKAMARLRRQGIILTEAEEKQIKAHVKNNDTLAAQNVIIAALDKRYGGSFIAKGGTTAGRVAKFTDSIEDLQRALATALLPAVGNIADALTDLLADPEIQKGVEDLGREIGKLFSKENIKEGARILGRIFDTLKSAAPAIKSALSGVGAVLKTAFDAFNSLPPDIQKLLIGGFAVNKLTGGLVGNIAGGIFGALKAMTVQAGVVNVTGGVVNGGGLPGGKGGLGGAAAAGGVGLGTIAIGAAGLAAISQAIADGANQAFRTGTNKNPGFKAPQMFNPIPALQNIGTVLGIIKDQDKQQTTRIDALKDQANRTKDDTVAATKRVQTAALETKRETSRGANMTTAATRSGTSQVVSAIRSSRPIITTNVNVSATTVTKKTTTVNRYTSLPSREKDDGRPY